MRATTSPEMQTTGKRVAVVAAFALLLAAVLPVCAQTGSTKFIPTFLIYYGGGPRLLSSDAPALAKFDLIDVDRFRYYDFGQGAWAAIKSLNPNTQIYVYEDGSEASDFNDATLQVYLNDLGRYNVSRGHSMGSLNGNHPELFLLDAQGARIFDTGASNPTLNEHWYLMDFGSAAYQSYWLEAVNADIVSQPWVADGVFADDCPAIDVVGFGRFSGVPTRYPDDASWSAAMNSFAAGIASGLHGRGQKLWCNLGQTRFANGSNAWLQLDAGASPPDALLEEGAFAVAFGPPNWAVQYYPEADWKRQVDTLAAIRNSRVAMLGSTKLLPDPGADTGTDNLGKPVTYWQALWYSLGSFLLGKNDVLGNAYFMFAGGSGYNRIWWYNEYDAIDLGKAIGPYSVTSFPSATNVYWREFANGFVYVNPTANDLPSMPLLQPGRQLTHGNLGTAPASIPMAGAISLNSHSAAIVLKADVTRYQEDNAAVSGGPAGAWVQRGADVAAFSAGTAVSSNVAGAGGTFAFTGTGVSWIGLKCNVCGIANVSIDGGPATSVDTAGASAPGSPGLASETVFTASGLASGSHSLAISVTGATTSGGTHVAVDAFDVTP
jgi:Hypothetical glycosyl hydrolase family 15